MQLKINNHIIKKGSTFVIAEIGNNHNGSFERAIKMIDQAKRMGADCAKFQMRNMSEVYRKKSLTKDGEDLGTEYIVDLLDRFELDIKQHKELYNYCTKIGIQYLCTPWDTASLEVLESFNLPAYKVASADLTNVPLLDALTNTKKPLILSTGMSTNEEIEKAISFLKNKKTEFVLLHCNSTYPAPLHDINLNWIRELQKKHSLIGYSGHERGINISLAAVGLGACVIERHFTLDRNMEGPDHAASLTYDEFSKMIDGIREIEKALGDSNERKLSQGEMINRENLGKSLVSSKDLKSGTVITNQDVIVKSPGQGLSPQLYDNLIGKTLKRDMKKEDFFYMSDITENQIKPRPYNFQRPWGVPVRYHDFKEYSDIVSPDLWEFHLSYSDMELEISDYLDGEYNENFVVHAPELFSKSRLMDLASPDEKYRNFSIEETQKVINITRELKSYFPKTKSPLIVANIGGFSMDSTLPDSEKYSLYKLFEDSLKKLDMDGVEIIPQTMAPFPWHFGGQRYQNLFVDIDEIVEWCEKLNLKMCFDVSHTQLTCNFFKQDIYEYAKKIAPFTSHIHMGDAKGLNGEGLQIGEGQINFKKLGKILNDGCPDASFIPEIWQGHKNNGEGFWIALEKLESQM